MTGSGNDFVVIDGREGLPAGIDAPEAIAALCSRTDGVGADGVVILDRHPSAAFTMRYYNRDGTRGEMCGNASLCSASLAWRLGLTGPGPFDIATDAGTIVARIEGANPEIAMPPVTGLRPDVAIPLAPGERRLGYADTGVPHLVVLVDDAESVDVLHRGRELRSHPSLLKGANVNFVSALPGGWRMRTYERGVEGETRACGTGAVAVAGLLAAWGLALPDQPISVRTTSRRILTVTLPTAPSPAPCLRGEGRVAFTGVLADIWPQG